MVQHQADRLHAGRRASSLPFMSRRHQLRHYHLQVYEYRVEVELLVSSMSRPAWPRLACLAPLHTYKIRSSRCLLSQHQLRYTSTPLSLSSLLSLLSVLA
jgi:uncharacterized protein YcaQ